MARNLDAKRIEFRSDDRVFAASRFGTRSRRLGEIRGLFPLYTARRGQHDLPTAGKINASMPVERNEIARPKP